MGQIWDGITFATIERGIQRGVLSSQAASVTLQRTKGHLMRRLKSVASAWMERGSIFRLTVKFFTEGCDHISE
jgi:hypothetical protein